MNHIQQLIINSVAQISAQHNIKFDNQKASSFMIQTQRERIQKIMDAVKKESDDANFLLSKKPTLLMIQVGQVTLQHEIMKYAQEILEHAKTEDEK
jgi:hypothetical protein